MGWCWPGAAGTGYVTGTGDLGSRPVVDPIIGAVGRVAPFETLTCLARGRFDTVPYAQTSMYRDTGRIFQTLVVPAAGFGLAIKVSDNIKTVVVHPTGCHVVAFSDNGTRREFSVSKGTGWPTPSTPIVLTATRSRHSRKRQVLSPRSIPRIHLDLGGLHRMVNRCCLPVSLLLAAW